MDILVKDLVEREKILNQWKSEQLLFTPFVNSTCVVNGQLNGIRIHESDLINIEGDDKVVGIVSNYYSWFAKDFIMRKKKERRVRSTVKKPRSLQGDGKSFNSQITFIVLGEHTRDNPDVVVKGAKQKLRNDKHVKNAIAIDGYNEKIIKPYKVKLFRNGHISIPGVLAPDLSDADAVIANLCEYLTNLLGIEVSLERRWATTRNYKFSMISNSLDLLKFQEYCNGHFTNLLNTRWENIEGFIIKPIWMDRTDQFITCVEPHVYGDYMDIYSRYASTIVSDSAIGFNAPPTIYEEIERRKKLRIEKLPKKLIHMGEFYRHLKECDKVKNLYISFPELCKNILSEGVLDMHLAIEKYVSNVYALYFIKISAYAIELITHYTLTPIITKIKTNFKKSKNNIISHVKYDPEIFAGFIVRVKTPTKEEPAKLTTIKLFSSGKINIDGANDSQEAEFIYYWVNHIFLQNQSFIYNDTENMDEADDSYSYTDEDVE